MALEFGRTVTFGRFLTHDSLMHRADPRAKLLIVSALATALLATREPAAIAAAAVGVIGCHAAARIPLRYALQGLRVLLITLSMVSLAQILLTPNPLDPWWQAGPFSLSAGGLRNAALIALRVILVYHISSLLLFTTNLVDLADGIEQLAAPLKRLGLPIQELTLTFTLALRFVPLLVTELERLIRAHAARGLMLERGPLARTRQIGRLLIPLFINAFARADQLTQALDARCYRGGAGRTRRRRLQMQRNDWLMLTAALSCAAASLWMTLR